MKHQLNSFKCAVRGILYTINSESHMRFHMVAGFYVIIFSFFYHMSLTRWAVIIGLIAAILVAETFNTCLEELCNLATQSYDPIARIAKDIAAGAVLILALSAVVIAFIFYFDLKVISQILNFFLANPLFIGLFVFSAIVSTGFVGYGPAGIKQMYHKFKANR